MANNKIQTRDGYQPQSLEKMGYQPSGQGTPVSTDKIQGGYQPSTSQGNNPVNPPIKK